MGTQCSLAKLVLLKPGSIMTFGWSSHCVAWVSQSSLRNWSWRLGCDDKKWTWRSICVLACLGYRLCGLETIELYSTWFWSLGSLRPRFQQIPWLLHESCHHPLCPCVAKGERALLGLFLKKLIKKKKKFICLGCAGLCCVGTLSCHECGWPVAGRWAPHCGGFCCGAQALGWASVVGVRAPRLGLPSSRAQAQSLWCTGGGLVAPPYVGSSWIRDQTCVSCTGRKILKPLATREACLVSLVRTLALSRGLFL